MPRASLRCRTTRSTRRVATLDEWRSRDARRASASDGHRALWYHFTFNGAKGSILEDPALRRAVAKGINRQAIADVFLRGLVDKPAPLNNHVYVAGQEGYQDNSAAVAYDPEKAKQELDALGWRMNGPFREKDARQLVIRDVLYDSLSTGSTDRSHRTASPRSASSSTSTSRPAAASSPTTSPSATSTSPNSAGEPTRSPFWPHPDLSHQLREQLRQDRQPRDRCEDRTDGVGAGSSQGPSAGQRSRQDAVRGGFSLLDPGARKRRGALNLANFGAFGLADPDYTKIGFMKQ